MYNIDYKLKKEYHQMEDDLFHTDKANYYKRAKMNQYFWLDIGFPLDKIEKVKYHSDYLLEFERVLHDNSVSRSSLIVEFNRLKNNLSK